MRACSLRATRALALAITLSCAASSHANEPVPFTVADSIAVRRIIAPYREQRFTTPPAFIFSPDERHFTFLTRQGDLQTGRDTYRLEVLESASVRSFLASSGSPLPRRERVVEMSIAPENDDSSRAAIEGVRWVSDDILAFIGRQDSNIGQVYFYSISTQRLRRVTNSPYDLASFDSDANGRRLVVGAYAVPDWRERDLHGFAVATHRGDIADSIVLTAEEAARVGYEQLYFVADSDDGSLRPLPIGSSYLWPSPISVSPDGRWVAIPTTLFQIPVAWRGYEGLVRAERLHPRHVETSTDSFLRFRDEFALPTPQWVQYHLIDLQTFDTHPLFDAPARIGRWGNGIEPAWSPDSRRVLVPNAFMPLTGSQGEERARRERDATLLEIDAETRTVRRVAPMESGRGTAAALLTAVRWLSDASIELRRLDPEQGDAARFYRLSRRPTGWNADRSWIGSHPEVGGGAVGAALSLRIAQTLNTSPQVVARNVRSGAEKPISQLNPQLASFALGRVEQFRWSDRLGRSFTGGLVLPPGYDRTRRYPIVVQANGFDPQAYLLDGPYEGIYSAAPFAARALAGRGFVVLQLPRLDGVAAVEDPADRAQTSPQRWLVGLEAALARLNSDSVIDLSRVGLLGFSREGMFVHHAVTFSNYRFAAATVADSVCLSPRCYAEYFGGSRGMDLWDTAGPDAFIGAPLRGDGIQTWVERSDLFHLDRIRTPIRYETYGRDLSRQWENFALERRNGLPVELFMIPLGVHTLRAPFATFASKQGNVDWFDFWLAGREDPDPAKEAQYARWRQLRDDWNRAGGSTSQLADDSVRGR